jgi:uncharacterized membrane protein YqjE
MMKKVMNGLYMIPLLAGMASAQAVEYFTLPADFQDNAILTITTAFGVILGALVVIWAVRKVIKLTNRS